MGEVAGVVRKQLRVDLSRPWQWDAHQAADCGKQHVQTIDHPTSHIQPHTALSKWSLVPRGLEPRTLRLLAVCSDQLSYETC